MSLLRRKSLVSSIPRLLPARFATVMLVQCSPPVVSRRAFVCGTCCSRQRRCCVAIKNHHSRSHAHFLLAGDPRTAHRCSQNTLGSSSWEWRLGAMVHMITAPVKELPLVGCPRLGTWSLFTLSLWPDLLHAPSFSTRMKYAFATSYALQQIAVLGAAVTTRAFIPLKKPLAPSLLQIIPAAPKRPRACLISGSEAIPLVCRSVLITSRGVVAAAANPPANPPAVQCVKGS